MEGWGMSTGARSRVWRPRSADEVAAALGSRVDVKEWRAVCARSRLRPSSELVDSAVRFQLIERRPGGFEFARFFLASWKTKCF